MTRSAAITAPPVVLLIFANDVRAGSPAYLRHLPEERRRIDDALAPLERQGRCRLVTEPNATVGRVFTQFDRHRDDIVGVHFGGHADPSGLRLDDGDGQPSSADMHGVAGGLAHLPRLRWVFLNGCGTAAHVATLHAQAAVPVIATERAIRDDVATAFAFRFHHALAHGATLSAAFDAARSATRAADATPQDILRPGESTRCLRPGGQRSDDDWPWILLPPTHAPEATGWRLTAGGPEAQGGASGGQPLASVDPSPAALQRLLEEGHGPTRPGLGARAPDARMLLSLLAETLTASGQGPWSPGALEASMGRATANDAERRSLLTSDWGTPLAFLTRVEQDTGVLGPHDGRGRPWRFLHRAYRVHLAGEALAMRGVDAITRRLALAAGDPESLKRWGDPIGAACTRLDDPAAPFRRFGRREPDQAARLLLALPGLPPAIALPALFALEPDQGRRWNGEHLLRLARGWPVTQAVASLTGRVTPDLDLDRLAFVHFALDQLGAPPDRYAFFEAACRHTARAPRPECVPVPGGRFVMGDDHRQVEVIISQAFGLGRTPVTLEQYRTFDPDQGEAEGLTHPVTGISWWRAWLYAAWVGGRLPTESEWEYACRAGATSRFWSGDANADLDRVGWYADNSKGRSQPVGRRPPNPWGLFDMHGNVWEWCNCGWGDPPAPSEGPVADPHRAPTGSGRVLRGGAHDSSADGCRAALRSWQASTRRLSTVGFRVAIDP